MKPRKAPKKMLTRMPLKTPKKMPVAFNKVKKMPAARGDDFAKAMTMSKKPLGKKPVGKKLSILKNKMRKAK